jgi:hypothetical protein
VKKVDWNSTSVEELWALHEEIASILYKNGGGEAKA